MNKGGLLRMSRSASASTPPPLVTSRGSPLGHLAHLPHHAHQIPMHAHQQPPSHHHQLLHHPHHTSSPATTAGGSSSYHDIKSEDEDAGVGSSDLAMEEELLLKWDDHHRSFFELAEDLCHQEQFIDVTLSCGEHNFPAHKLVLSVCSPYFRHLFLRNPCKHPIVVLKDVSYRYMKLLLMYMYRGEVSCPQEDLHGLLRTARSLQIRGLVELERKREAEGGLLTNSITGSPLKRARSNEAGVAVPTAPTPEEYFSLDEVRSRLQGQLEIQPIISSYSAAAAAAAAATAAAAASSSTPWMESGSGSRIHDVISKAVAKSSSTETATTGSEEDDRGLHRLHPRHRHRLHPRLQQQHHERSTGSPSSPGAQRPRSRSRPRSSSSSTASSNAAMMAASAVSQASEGIIGRRSECDDPMSSMNALLAAAQAHGNLPPSSLASLIPTSPPPSPPPTTTSATTSSATATTTTPPAASATGNGKGPASEAAGGAEAGSNGQVAGVDLSQAAAVANLYYYMQKVASAGMGNPKERKECPICGKTLYDRSTWNRHMRIHTGEKPYPCRFCGRRFRTNYNKLGHEKKCPDRHARALLGQQQTQQAVSSGGDAEAEPDASPEREAGGVAYR